MRFSTLLLPLGLAAGLVDGASILTAMGIIANATIALNSSVTSFREDGDPLKLLPIIVDSSTLLSDIKSGTKSAQASANLTVDEAFSVAGATISLVSGVQTTLANIIAGKDLFSLELVSPIIYLNLEEEKAATDQFSAAVLAKVPASLLSIAEGLVAPIDPAFEAAIAAYKGAL
jgi:hypothetical protein